ncbi:MAG: LamG-like jellyroll fold domain-containing protein, partial [Gammaproteobacteria bacterium]
MNNNKASSTEFVLAGLTARIAHSVSRWTSRTKNQLRALLCIAAATAATPALGAAGPVLYLPFDEGAGSATVDAGTDGNDGTLTGGATWIGGQIGAAISFDGQNDFVQTGFAKHLPGWTVSAWVRSPAAPAAGVPNGPVHREDNFVISWDHPAEAFRGAMALSVGGDWRAASFGPLLPNTWHHLAGTYDGETLRS